MPPAKRTIRPRDFWASGIPEARSSTGSRKPATRRRLRSRATGRSRIARSLLLRIKNVGALFLGIRRRPRRAARGRRRIVPSRRRRRINGARRFRVRARIVSRIVLSGGVAANSALQGAVRAWSAKRGVPAFVPPPKYCTDNAAMIAAAAFYQGDAARADPLTLSADPSLRM